MMTSVLRAAIISLALVLGASSASAQGGDALPFFASYNITGNYAVAGVDLARQNSHDGFVTGTIQVTGVPINADILAAFLYWETVWTDESQLSGALFRGQPVSGVKSSTVPLSGPYSACWSGGAANLTIMRADVRRLLPPQLDPSGKPTGRRVVLHSELQKYQSQFPADKWLLTVTLPDAGVGAPQSAGASLLIVYRDPDPRPGNNPQQLRTVVVYDGAAIQAQGAVTTQKIRGFFQSSIRPQARLTPIGGTGARNLTDRLLLTKSGVPTLVANDPFAMTLALTDRAWSNPTYDVSGFLPGVDLGGGYGEELTMRLDHTSSLPYDCMSLAAVVFSTTDRDTDGDGLVDKVEQTSGLVNPAGEPLPDITPYANPLRKDLFLEVGRMVAPPNTTYGSPEAPFSATQASITDVNGHDHMPDPFVWKAFGDAFANAPNPVAVHVDVGPLAEYRALGGAYGLHIADQYLIDGSLARGGEIVTETKCVPRPPNPLALPPDPGNPCRFEAFPGTVSWNTAYQLLVHASVGPNGEEFHACQTTGDCDRHRFDANREGIFRYVLYAHARGTPKSEFPCVIDDMPSPGDADGMCAAGVSNPDYLVPSSSSGVSEASGKYFMVTLGLWDNFRGTDKMQANTTLHEIGHTLGLWHGGGAPSFTLLPNGRTNVYVQPNCKPNYFSIMSYLFQATGAPAYSSAINQPVNEASLFDAPIPGAPYPTSWYTPLLPGTRGVALGIPAAKKHCDGTPLLVDANGDPTELPMGRLDAPTPFTLVDWAGDGGATTSGQQDVNFDGFASGNKAFLTGFNDWSGIRLNQLGGGRNLSGFSLGLDLGGTDGAGLDLGGLDLGGLDLGGLDLGGLDLGGLDLGGLDLGGLDLGGLDLGGLDLGGLDLGGLDLGGLDLGGLDLGGAELTYDVVIDSVGGGGPTGPDELEACVLGGTTGNPICETGSDPLHRTRLTWEVPSVGTPDTYRVGRAWDPSGSADIPAPGSDVEVVGTTTGAVRTLDDPDELPNGERFIYFAQGAIGPRHGALSRFAVVTAENAPPVAVNDVATTAEDTFVDIDILPNDTDVDTASNGDLRVGSMTSVHGGIAVLLPNGRTVRFFPAPNANSVNTPGGFGFSYTANDGPWSVDSEIVMSDESNIGDVSITVIPVNDAPAGTDKTLQVIEDGEMVLSAGDFGFTDPSDIPAHNLSRVAILTLPAAGVLALDGNALVPGTYVTIAQINAGALTFTPAANTSGTPYASFIFQVEDDGGTALGGENLDATPNTITIHVTPLTWVATTGSTCFGTETPEVAIAGNAITMGAPRSDTSMPQCIHGASALLPPLVGPNTKYRVTFRYNLFTWDAYNAFTGSGTGYWDSFSVTVATKPYAQLFLDDPITAGQSGGELTGVGLLWGGSNYLDGILNCNPDPGACGGVIPPAQTTVDIAGNVAGDSYLNVMLDNFTLPEANHLHPSYGTITILAIEQVP